MKAHDSDFQVRDLAAVFDHRYTVRGALSPPHTSRVPQFATQVHGQARDMNLNAAQGNTQDMEATLENQLSNFGRSARVAARPNGRPAPPHGINVPERLSLPSLGII